MGRRAPTDVFVAGTLPGFRQVTSVVPDPSAGPGRPGGIASGSMGDPSAPVLAIDIGGTKLAAGVVSADGEIVARASTPTLAGASGDELFAALMAMVDPLLDAALERGLSPDVCGVGCGG